MNTAVAKLSEQDEGGSGAIRLYIGKQVEENLLLTLDRPAYSLTGVVGWTAC